MLIESGSSILIFIFRSAFLNLDINTSLNTPIKPTINEAIERLNDQIFKGNNGKDIIKYCFNYLGEELSYKRAEAILGFNNGWVLPFLEKVNNFLLLSYTDYSNVAYNRAMKMVKEYSEEEKETVRAKLLELISITI